MSHTWVTSMGGPLIMIPESACQYWTGSPPTYPDDEGDYGRACSVEDLIGIIEVGPTQALVLGDDPAATTFLPEHSLLVRQIAGDPDVDYSPAVAELLPQVVWDSRVEWTVQEPLVLFDSVHDHTEIESEEHLHIALAPERYMVEAAYAEIPDEASLILVRFAPHGATA
ncbi:Imm21 family immunity protein [Streptomyces sp. NBC_01451]|uniref:Imm21 family immunity protein n=1 Tax=Streptomyces sp. NBC_01451 TaxID=2903872 RepID=UPI002E343E19|nr:Imm21 family immunity protein [Streptomyces sp. NBC_01451]